MRLLVAKAILAPILLSIPALALPRPQVADSVDASGNTGQASAGPAAANAFPDDGQAVGSDNTPPSVGSSIAAASTTSSPAASTTTVDQGAGLVDGQVLSTPLTVDLPSNDLPPQAKSPSSVKNATNLGRPGELTGELLGMANCSGIFYNPRWDRYVDDLYCISSFAAQHAEILPLAAMRPRARSQRKSNRTTSARKGQPSLSATQLSLGVVKANASLLKTPTIMQSMSVILPS